MEAHKCRRREGLLLARRTENKEQRQDVGLSLKEAREQREISLEEVARETSYHVHQLEAVERGDYEALPHVLWAQGILKSYGTYVGLNGERLARDLFPTPLPLKVKRYLRYRWRVLGAALATIAAAASLAVALIFFPYNAVTGGASDQLEKIAPGTFVGTEPQRVAVFGFVAGGEINAEDNVLVAELAKQGLGLVSVPGDTPARVPGQGRGNIGDVLALDRPDLTRQAVSDLANEQVQYYVVVSTNGIREVVDSMGGVTVDVPRPVSGSASTGEPAITVRPGLQKLDGEEAIVYLEGGDLRDDAGIAKRQQTFLFAMFRQAIGPSNLLTNPSTIRVVSENVETNMGTIQMAQLSGRALKLVERGETLKMSDIDAP
jgi:LCP family protein required for cell wall assembly